MAETDDKNKEDVTATHTSTNREHDVTHAATSTSRTCLRDVSDADGVRHVAVRELTASLTCLLCKGYLIDAHTVTNCLHSFCKACLLSYLKTNPVCPACGLKASLGNRRDVRPDRVLQDLVYAFVPSLFENEMNKRRQFYRSYMQSEYGMAASKAISVCLKLCDGCPPYDEAEEKHLLDTRYLLCPAHFPVKFLDKFIRLKFSLDATHKIDIYFKNERLYEDYTLQDVAVVYGWSQEEAMTIYYVVEDTVKSLVHRIRASEKRRITASQAHASAERSAINQNIDSSAINSSLEVLDTSQSLDTSQEVEINAKRDAGNSHTRGGVTQTRVNGIYRPVRPLTPKVARKRGRPPKLKHKAAGIIAIQAKRQALKQVRQRMTPTPTMSVASGYTLPRQPDQPSHVLPLREHSQDNQMNVVFTNSFNQPGSTVPDQSGQGSEAVSRDSTGTVFHNKQRQHNVIPNQIVYQPKQQQTIAGSSSHLPVDNTLATRQQTANVSNVAVSNVYNIHPQSINTGQHTQQQQPSQQNMLYNQSSQSVPQPIESQHMVGTNTFGTQNIVEHVGVTPQQNVGVAPSHVNVGQTHVQQNPNNTMQQNITYTYNTGSQGNAIQSQPHVNYQSSPTTQVDEEPVTIPGLLPPKRRKRGRPPRRQTFSPRLHHGPFSPFSGYGTAIKRKRGRPPKRKVGLPPVLVVSQSSIQGTAPQLVHNQFVQNHSMMANQNQSLVINQGQGQAVSTVAQPQVTMTTVGKQMQQVIANPNGNQSNPVSVSYIPQTQVELRNNNQAMAIDLNTLNNLQQGTAVSTSMVNTQGYKNTATPQQCVANQPIQMPRFGSPQIATVPGKNTLISPFEQQFEKFIQSTAKQIPFQNKKPRAAPMSHVCIERITDLPKRNVVSASDSNRVQRTCITKPTVFSGPPPVTNVITSGLLQSGSNVPVSNTMINTPIHNTGQLAQVVSSNSVPNRGAVPVSRVMVSTPMDKTGSISLANMVNTGPVRNSNPMSLADLITSGSIYNNRSILHNAISGSSQQNATNTIGSHNIHQHTPRIQYITMNQTPTNVSQVVPQGSTQNQIPVQTNEESFEDAVVIDSSPDSPDSSSGNQSSPASASKKRPGIESKERKRVKLHSITQKLYSSLGEKHQGNNGSEMNGNQINQVTYHERTCVPNDTRLPAQMQPQLMVSQDSIATPTTLTHSDNGSEIGAHNDKGLMRGCGNGSVMLIHGNQAISSHAMPSHSQSSHAVSHTISNAIPQQAVVGSNMASQGYSISETNSITARPLSPSNALASIASIQELVNNSPALHSNPMLAPVVTKPGRQIRPQFRASGNAQLVKAIPQVKSSQVRPPFKGHVMPNRVSTALLVARQRTNACFAKQRKQLKVKNKARNAPQIHNISNNISDPQQDQAPVYVGVNVISCAYIQPQDGVSNHGNMGVPQQAMPHQQEGLQGQMFDGSGAKQISAVKPCYRQPLPTHVAKQIDLSDSNDKPLDFSMKKQRT